MLKRIIFITFLLLVVVVCNDSFSMNSVIHMSSHVIAGFGPIGGDLVLPQSSFTKDNKLYVLDLLGISIFDLQTQLFIKRFPLEMELINSGSLEKPINWKNYLKNISVGSYYFLSEPTILGSNLIYEDIPFIKNEMCLDSNNNLYVLSRKGIYVYDLFSEVFIKLLPIFDQIDLTFDDRKVSYTFKIVDDKIYVLQTTKDAYFVRNNNVFIFSIDGILIKKISCSLDNSQTFSAYISDFIVIPKLQLIVIAMVDIGKLSSDSSLPIHFYTMSGEIVSVVGESNVAITPEAIDIVSPDTIIVSGLTNEGSCSILFFKFHENKEENFEVTYLKSVTIPEFGTDCIDLSFTSDIISIITSGPFDSIWDFKTFIVQDDNIMKIGTSSNQIGQILGSLSFSIDSENNLLTTNNSQNTINKFNILGEYQSQIKLDLKQISPVNRSYNSTPCISNMITNKGDIFVTNINPNTIAKYSCENVSWEMVYFDKSIRAKVGTWIDMDFYGGKLFLLEYIDQGVKAPTLYNFSLENSNLYLVKGFLKSREKNMEPPLFIGFAITDQEYQFLDCANQNIWIYDFYTQNLKGTIQLPKDPKSFYSSFDLYPDGSWIVTDVTQCRLLHISRKGEIIEIIGSKGQVELGTTKEAYLEKPDQFYLPIRAKIANNKIYVSDFGNCRYHIIPITQLDSKPTIQWEQESVKLDKFSVFSEKIVDLPFTVTSTKEFPFTLTTSVPWIQFKADTGKSTDQQISIKVQGDKLTPWQTNTGTIQVTFPDYTELNKTISVTVNATGNIVTLTIGSSIATLNDQDITLDSASVPLLKKGRTFVGIRFMGEIVFSNTAKISFDAKTQTVYFEIGSVKIELTINQPYALVNGTKVALDAPPFIQNGRTFVPLRFVAENLDATIDYEAKAQNITITYPKRK